MSTAKRRGASFFRRHLLALASIFVAGTSLYVSSEILSNQEMYDAWRRISAHVPGNSGIRPALEHLRDMEEQLVYIDLRPFRDALAEGEMSRAFVGSIDLSHQNLNGSRLSHTDFSGASFDDSDLQAVMVNGTDFTKATFLRAKMEGMEGMSPIFLGADLTGAYLSGATLRHADLRASIMDKIVGKKLNIEGSTAINTKFEDAKLMEAYLREMKGIGASFMGAVLEKADLTYATFAGTSFQRASLGDANLTGATFAYADLTDVDLTDATLAFSRFKGANLSGVKFGDVDLIEDMGIEWTDVWAWSDNPPALPEHITEAIRLVYFDPQCRPGWEGRINTEIGYGEEAKLAAIRYRPPDDACLVNESTD